MEMVLKNKMQNRNTKTGWIEIFLLLDWMGECMDSVHWTPL